MVCAHVFFAAICHTKSDMYNHECIYLKCNIILVLLYDTNMCHYLASLLYTTGCRPIPPAPAPSKSAMLRVSTIRHVVFYSVFGSFSNLTTECVGLSILCVCVGLQLHTSLWIRLRVSMLYGMTMRGFAATHVETC